MLRDVGAIPGSGASPGRGHGNPLPIPLPGESQGGLGWAIMPGGLQSTGLQRVGHDWSDLARTHNSTYLIALWWRRDQWLSEWCLKHLKNSIDLFPSSASGLKGRPGKARPSTCTLKVESPSSSDSSSITPENYPSTISSPLAFQYPRVYCVYSEVLTCICLSDASICLLPPDSRCVQRLCFLSGTVWPLTTALTSPHTISHFFSNSSQKPLVFFGWAECFLASRTLELLCPLSGTSRPSSTDVFISSAFHLKGAILSEATAPQHLS